MEILRGMAIAVGYVLSAWVSWHLVGAVLWNGDDLSQIATPAAMIATAFLIGRCIEFAADTAVSRWRRQS
jgi:ABC-type nitrate/sulfonate/bicarbonate transport system permease component